MQVDLSEPIISRFDVLCIVKDEVDEIQDQHLADFVVKSHIKHHPAAGKDVADVVLTNTTSVPLIDQDILKKYIVYAKQNVRPKLSNVDDDKLSQLFSKLRKESEVSKKFLRVFFSGVNVAIFLIDNW